MKITNLKPFISRPKILFPRNGIDNKQFAFLINDTKILEKGDTNGE